MSGASLPAWALWPEDAGAQPWRVGLEEEVMVLSDTGQLAPVVDDLLPTVPQELRDHASAETHAATLELATAPHARVADAVAELAGLRLLLARSLAGRGLRAAVAGTHPLATSEDAAVSPGARYSAIHESMRELARREPTFALHVHVGVPDPEAAVRALDGLRRHLPLLLALSGNSPFWRGRDSGLMSARTPIFGAFPRVGIPRRFGDYASYVEVVDTLLRCGAFPEPTFLWWDARLQPRYGTVEVRIMDAQTRVEDVAPLAALVQCLVRHHAEVGAPDADASELLHENRFLAARDGVRARLIDAHRECGRPLTETLEDLLEVLGPVADGLDAADELADLWRLVAQPGALHQRAVAGAAEDDRGALLSVLDDLAVAFAPEAQAVAA